MSQTSILIKRHRDIAAIGTLSCIQVIALYMQISFMQLGNYETIWSINGAVSGLIIFVFALQYMLLPKKTDDLQRDEILELGGKYKLIKRQLSLYLLTYLQSALLILVVPNYYFQLLVIAALFSLNIAIYTNCFNNNFQFRVLYGLETALLMLTSTCIYALLHYNLFLIPIYIVPFFLLAINYFAFDYLLMKRKHRIYTSECIRCHFRRNRSKHILTYSLISTGFFLFLLYANTNVLLAGLVLSTLLHTMRGYTCGNFKKYLTYDLKQSYIYLLLILIVIVISTMNPISDSGRTEVPDSNNHQAVSADFLE